MRITFKCVIIYKYEFSIDKLRNSLDHKLRRTIIITLSLRIALDISVYHLIDKKIVLFVVYKVLNKNN